jgi:hypothetical protein
MATSTALAVTEQFRPEFDNRWQTEYQQMIARTSGMFEAYPVMGTDREFPLLAKTDSVRRLTQRFEETAPSDITTGKRKIKSDPYLSSLIFDRKDQKKFGTLESPIAPSIANQRAEIARNQDETVVGVAGQVGGLLGSAIQVDADGVVSYPVFDSTFTIPVNYDKAGSGGAGFGMTYDKLTRLKQKLAQYNVRSQDSTTNNPSGLCLLLGYSQIDDLLHDPKLYNRDNATALLEQVMDGQIHDVQGFTIRAIDDDILPIAAGVRTCIAFAKRGVAFGYNEMPNHELDVLPTKTHAIQSTFYFDWGLGRIWDQAVWKVPCLEA